MADDQKVEMKGVIKVELMRSAGLNLSLGDIVELYNQKVTDASYYDTCSICNKLKVDVSEINIPYFYGSSAVVNFTETYMCCDDCWARCDECNRRYVLRHPDSKCHNCTS